MYNPNSSLIQQKHLFAVKFNKFVFCVRVNYHDLQNNTYHGLLKNLSFQVMKKSM